jgi:hypothetical protein
MYRSIFQLVLVEQHLPVIIASIFNYFMVKSQVYMLYSTLNTKQYKLDSFFTLKNYHVLCFDFLSCTQKIINNILLLTIENCITVHCSSSGSKNKECKNKYGYFKPLQSYFYIVSVP